MRHDAQQARAGAQSERIRLSLGLLTPTERKAQEESARERREHEAREAAKGLPLFEDLP